MSILLSWIIKKLLAPVTVTEFIHSYAEVIQHYKILILAVIIIAIALTGYSVFRLIRRKPRPPRV